eukprot:364462-Chlamydomonas_euryale.AAC.8
MSAQTGMQWETDVDRHERSGWLTLACMVSGGRRDGASYPCMVDECHRYTGCAAWPMHRVRDRVRATGSGPMQGVPVLSVARQRGSSSGLGTVAKRTPLRTVLNHPIPTPPRQPGRENWGQSL